jgi:hypothetical protein
MYHMQPDSISILRSTETNYTEDTLLYKMTCIRVGTKAMPPTFLLLNVALLEFVALPTGQ